LKAAIKKRLHSILMPRGKNYIHLSELERGWDSVSIPKSQKSISTIYKILDPKFPTVFLCHPYLAESRQFFLKRGHAQFYLDLGVNVVLFDFNGFGKSAFVNFKYEEDLDIVVKHFKVLLPESHFIGHGISFGASQVINYSSQSNPLFHHIIIENCLDSNLSYYKKRNPKLHMMMRILMILIPGVNKNHNYIKSAHQISGVASALLIYNEDDDLTTISMGKQIQDNLRMVNRFIICKGKHLEAFEKNKDLYTHWVNTLIFNSVHLSKNP
jgi:predicted alpha/beta-fold hydrolase